ncbi:hypothetical protein HDU96_004974 [Phlyctochytrium bullatum]|nr:hypothetical protein HDU96_004974 [Phlyctochytrium bullatum]
MYLASPEPDTASVAAAAAALTANFSPSPSIAVTSTVYYAQHAQLPHPQHPQQLPFPSPETLLQERTMGDDSMDTKGLMIADASQPAMQDTTTDAAVGLLPPASTGMIGNTIFSSSSIPGVDAYQAATTTTTTTTTSTSTAAFDIAASNANASATAAVDAPAVAIAAANASPILNSHANTAAAAAADIAGTGTGSPHIANTIGVAAASSPHIQGTPVLDALPQQHQHQHQSPLVASYQAPLLPQQPVHPSHYQQQHHHPHQIAVPSMASAAATIDQLALHHHVHSQAHGPIGVPPYLPYHSPQPQLHTPVFPPHPPHHHQQQHSPPNTPSQSAAIPLSNSQIMTTFAPPLSSIPSGFGANAIPARLLNNSDMNLPTLAFHSNTLPSVINSGPLSPVVPTSGLPKSPKQAAGKAATKIYDCQWEDCGKRCTRKQDLERHMVTHYKDKRHKCPECGISFSRKDAMRRHLKMERCKTKRPGAAGTASSSTAGIIGLGGDDGYAHDDTLVSPTQMVTPATSPSSNRKPIGFHHSLPSVTVPSDHHLQPQTEGFVFDTSSRLGYHQPHDPHHHAGAMPPVTSSALATTTSSIANTLYPSPTAPSISLPDPSTPHLTTSSPGFQPFPAPMFAGGNAPTSLPPLPPQHFSMQQQHSTAPPPPGFMVHQPMTTLPPPPVGSGSPFGFAPAPGNPYALPPPPSSGQYLHQGQGHQ